MKKNVILAMVALVMLSCSNVMVNNDGYVYDGNKLIKWVSPNEDTVVWYDWSPSKLIYLGDEQYTYQGYPCDVAFKDHADILMEMDNLQSLDAEGIYSDTYYDLLSVFSPVWIESEKRFILYHW